MKSAALLIMLVPLDAFAGYIRSYFCAQRYEAPASTQLAALVVRLFVFAVLFTITDLRVHDDRSRCSPCSDLSVHDGPIFVFTMLRNPH